MFMTEGSLEAPSANALTRQQFPSELAFLSPFRAQSAAFVRDGRPISGGGGGFSLFTLTLVIVVVVRCPRPVSVLPVGGPADKPEEEDDDEDEEEAAAAVDGAVMVALPSGTSSSLPSSSLSTSSSSLLDMTILSRDWIPYSRFRIISMGVAAGCAAPLALLPGTSFQGRVEGPLLCGRAPAALFVVQRQPGEPGGGSGGPDTLPLLREKRIESQ